MTNITVFLSIALGVVATGASALSILKIVNFAPISYTSLAKDNLIDESSDFEASNLFGRDYKYLMVGLSENNRHWWLNSYRKLQKNRSKLSEKFKYVVTPYDHKGVDALNRVCKFAYLSNTSNVVKKDDTGKKFIESEVWEYCSFIGYKPKTIAENKDSWGSSTLGNAKKDKLASTKAESNELFWETKEEEFFDSFKDVQDNEKHLYFRSYFKSGRLPNNSLKKHCEQAYNKTTSAPSPTQDELEKYCSVKSILPKKTIKKPT